MAVNYTLEEAVVGVDEAVVVLEPLQRYQNKIVAAVLDLLDKDYIVDWY